MALSRDVDEHYPGSLGQCLKVKPGTAWLTASVNEVKAALK